MENKSTNAKFTFSSAIRSMFVPFSGATKTLLMVHFRSRTACNTLLCKHSAGKPEDSQTQVEYMMSLDKYIRH